MNHIVVEQLRRDFTVFERGGSLAETAKSLLRRKKYTVSAVKDISFQVQAGELLGFIGPNGAGKSTTLKMLTGILFPSSGTAQVLGYVPWKERKKYVSHIGAVFGQKSQLIWDVPPIDAFLLNKAIYGINSVDFERVLGEMSELLDIGQVMRKPTRQLSLGERMKCEFVMAMLHCPEIVFLDEPTIGLDVIAKDRIREFITQMNERGTTFILTTHDVGDIEQLARRVMIVNHGEIAYDDSIDALRGRTERYKHVRFTTRREMGAQEPFPQGMTLSRSETPTEAECTVDLTKIDLGACIALVNERYGLLDMRVEEIPIENVIKTLYTT